MGENDADFEARFGELYPRVLAYAVRRTDDRQTAEDIAAETFAVAWRKRATRVDHQLPWLYGIARRLISNQHRGAARRAKLEHRLADETPPQGRDPLGLVVERESIRAAFAALSEREREVIALVAWEKVSSSEGAEVLDCTRAAFELRLFRARRKLEKELARAGHSPEEGPSPASRPASEKT